MFTLGKRASVPLLLVVLLATICVNGSNVIQAQSDFEWPGPVSCEDIRQDFLLEHMYTRVGSPVQFETWLDEHLGEFNIYIPDFFTDPSDAPNRYDASLWSSEGSYNLTVAENTLVSAEYSPGYMMSFPSTQTTGDIVVECLGEPDVYSASFDPAGRHSVQSTVLYYVDRGQMLIFQGWPRDPEAGVTFENYLPRGDIAYLHWMVFGPRIDPRVLNPPLDPEQYSEEEVRARDQLRDSFHAWPGDWEELIVENLGLQVPAADAGDG